MDKNSNRPQKPQKPRKPRLLLQFILALLVILFAYALDTYHKRLKAEEKAAAAQAVDTSAVKDTADTAQDTIARPHAVAPSGRHGE